MRNDVHRADVGGQDDDAVGNVGTVGARGEGGGGRERGFANRFDAFFHAAFEGFVFGRCKMC